MLFKTTQGVSTMILTLEYMQVTLRKYTYVFFTNDVTNFAANRIKTLQVTMKIFII